MYYIAFNKKTNRIHAEPSLKPFIGVTDNLEVAETETIPSAYDYLTVENLQEHTRIVKEAYTEEVTNYNEETGEEYTETVYHEQVTENYKTCDLVAHFKTLTAEQLEKQKAYARIKYLKEQLGKTDYQAIKYAEGWLTEEEYAPIKAQRQAYREEINQLEKL